MPLADEFRDPKNVPCSEVGPIRLYKERHQVRASIIMDTRCRQIMMRGYEAVGPTHLFKYVCLPDAIVDYGLKRSKYIASSAHIVTKSLRNRCRVA